MKRIFECLFLLFFVCIVSLVGCDTEEALVDITTPTDELQQAPGAPALIAAAPPALYKNISRMRYIPSGSFTMGYENSPQKRFAPKVVLDTEAYYMDMHEVTNADFMLFVEAGYTPEIDVCLKPDAADVNFYAFPALVSWNDAAAYAEWVGKRLPTEIEWEKAARGGIEGAMFPWGNEHPTLAPEAQQTSQFITVVVRRLTSMANEGAFAVHPYTGRDVGGSGIMGSAFGGSTYKPVGSYAPNAYGLFDMVGSASEWCSNEWNNNAYLLYVNGIEPKFDGKYYRNLYSHRKTLCHVVRGGGALHSMDAYTSWHDIFETLPEELKYRYIERTIHVGERGATPESGYSGFRLVMDISDNPSVLCAIKEEE